MIEAISNWQVTTDYFGTTHWCREEDVRELENDLKTTIEHRDIINDERLELEKKVETMKCLFKEFNSNSISQFEYCAKLADIVYGGTWQMKEGE